VDELGRESMCVAQSALLRQRGLRPLLKSPAVGHAAKDAGNELRIIDIAEAEENLVLFVYVGIGADIEGVFVFEELGGSRKIAKGSGKGWLRIKIEKLDGVRIQAIEGNDIQIAVCQSESRSASGARAERVPCEPGSGRHQTTGRVHLSLSN